MSVEYSDFLNAIKNAFPDSDIEVQDLTGTGDQYQVSIASREFDGLTSVKQHKMFNSRMVDYVGTKIHAVQLKTLVKA